MRALTAGAALRAWELGQPLDDQGRMLALLSVALPEVDRERLRKLPIGQRDALLVRLRQRTFGHLVKGLVKCMRCDAPLTFELDLRSYDAVEHLQHRVRPQWLTVHGYDVLFRLPDSTDFETVADRCMDAESARAMLLVRCVLEASRDGQSVAPVELSAAAVEELGARMEELDPLAELPLGVSCERCGCPSLVLFDIGRFLWQDITRSAHQLLDEVHALATTYGWTEPQILSLSAARRRYYLEKTPAKR